MIVNKVNLDVTLSHFVVASLSDIPPPSVSDGTAVVVTGGRENFLGWPLPHLAGGITKAKAAKSASESFISSPDELSPSNTNED